MRGTIGKNENSWFWRGFIDALYFIKTNIGWLISNGESILVWNCKWIPCGEGMRNPFSNISIRNLYMKDLWNSNRKWDITKLQNYFNDSRVIDDILKNYIPQTHVDDKRI